MIIADKIERRTEFYNNAPTIKSQLPVKIGKLVMKEFFTKCPICHCECEDESVRGHVGKVVNNVASIHLISSCYLCGKLDENFVRVKEAKGKNYAIFEFEQPNGRWESGQVSLTNKVGIIEKLSEIFKYLVGFKHRM